MCRGRICRASLLAGVLAAWCCAACAQSPNDLDRLIEQLDADSFAARENAAQALREIGKPALAALSKAREHKSLEVRYRAKAIAEGMTVGVRLREFTAFASLPDDKLDVEQGMWLISRMLDPEVKQHDLTRQLDELAQRVRERLGKGVDPATADPQVVVTALRQVLHVEQGFTGNVDDYNNPENSSLGRVLETKKGLPIILSHMTIAVARRLQAPIVGVPAGGRYIIKYDGSKAPAGVPQDDIYLNPFEDFRIYTRAEALALDTIGLDTSREALTRMLRNLQADLEGRGEPEKLQQARELFDMLEAYGPGTENGP